MGSNNPREKITLYFPKKKKGFIEGDGNQSRDFCYVDNVVMANILAMESKRNFKGAIVNIAHGERIKLNEVMKRMIESCTGRKLRLEKRLPRVGDVRHTHADLSMAERVLGYRPKTRFREGLMETIEWFESRKS